jgi:pyruvate/2-oxoglutarate dehydrogenase complex dihydrolipoamide acyltransferase (E2) component
MSDSIAILVPRENVNDESATLSAWLVKDGEHVEAGQRIAQIETSKTVVDLEAPASGILRHTAREGEDVAIGGLLGRIDAGATQAEPPVATLNGVKTEERAPAPAELHITPSPERPEPVSAPPSAPHVPVRLSRKARELVDRLGIDLKTLDGRGLVRSRDLTPGHPAPPPRPTDTRPNRASIEPAEPSAITPAAGVAFRTEPLRRAKKVEAKNLRTALRSSVTSSVTTPCRTRGLRALALKQNPTGDRVTAVIIHEAARLLRKYPSLNAFYANENVNLYEDVNIGFAIDAGRGLKVPVVRNADRKGIAEIADEMQERVVEYLADELPVNALSGGTFTITDLSSEGVGTFFPLMSEGQSAILGIGAELISADSGEGVFNLILSFDHQVAEGRTAGRFLGDLRARLASYEAALSSEVDTGGSQAGDEPYCERCGRTASELMTMDNYYLLQTIMPNRTVRLICSLCNGG